MSKYSGDPIINSDRIYLLYYLLFPDYVCIVSSQNGQGAIKLKGQGTIKLIKGTIFHKLSIAHGKQA